MKIGEKFEYPEKLKKKLKRAKVLEWITIFAVISIIIVMYLSMGSSQAMKTAWIEDILSLIPPISFLIASRIYHKKPNKKYPYGYHRISSIAYLSGSGALLIMGLFLIIDSGMGLLKAEHPTIATMEIFGYHLWQGWVMIIALVYSVIPPVILGRLKIPLAKDLHDKVLYADASMNKADWMTGAAAVLGIIGIGLGFWWADAVAALIISVDVLKDGVDNVKTAITDLMDTTPLTVGKRKIDPLVAELENYLKDLDWIDDAVVRLREEGHVYFGDASIVLHDQRINATEKIDSVLDELYRKDWKLYDLSIMPVEKIDDIFKAQL